ncbi:MAG: hypothetical protein KC426_02420 [Oceanospirillaceae bacterium]|nr:hypothetical protein [Oceanospirillaceae bacterium]
MIKQMARLGAITKFSMVMCLSLAIASCGFHLQGQSQRSFAPQINLFVDDDQLASAVIGHLSQYPVAINVLDSVVNADNTAPTLQLTRTLQHSAKLTLDANGDALVWRYTLSSHYLYSADGLPANTQEYPTDNKSLPISVTTDVDLSGSNATINERIKADSWALLYQQLGSRITRQLSFQ